MDFDEYARTAVKIVNTPLGGLTDLHDLLSVGHWAAQHPTDRDLATFKRVSKRLRSVFVHRANNRAERSVAELNALLEAFPVRPTIAGRPNGTWRMRVTGRGSSISSEVLAGAVWGLATWLCEHGSSRIGVCADEHCGNVYLDTSSNCCRRFCSERCATRSHVAAHRARKRCTKAASLHVSG
ncbi:MAG: CGNR zinc finger domain-containing protein [Dactylosporangium sp.]|nr:CGNR zinc finger domain-containing protein [Dactylosporangium sp.]NNJ61718.1 CGNR zinc finger domain-containing protein [Dactylosporangium sp.]